MRYRPFISSLLVSVSLGSFGSILHAEISKLGCKEVESIEVKCKELEVQNAACDTAVQAEVKAKIDAAKKDQEACKAKHSLQYIIKCKSEIKKATTLVNTPKMALNNSVQKEQLALPDSACSKAEVIGKEQKLCKSPKKVMEAMKVNCIKDM